MHCAEKDCLGNIDTTIDVTIPTGCHSVDDVHPCDTCGRLHWPSGDGIFNRSGDRAFLENGQLVNKRVDQVSKA